MEMSAVSVISNKFIKNICDNFEIDDDYVKLRTTILKYLKDNMFYQQNIEKEIDDDLYSDKLDVESNKIMNIYDNLYPDQFRRVDYTPSLRETPCTTKTAGRTREPLQ